MIASYALPVRSLATFRIIYALCVLVLFVPLSLWVPSVPGAFFNPPYGLTLYVRWLPPVGVVIAVNAALVLFASCLLVGYRTFAASIGTTAAMLLLNSWAFSFGKINHDILFVVAPVFLAFAGWGRAVSIDRRDEPRADERGEAWPLALFALVIAFAIMTSAWSKIATGWLDPSQLSTYGHLVRNHFLTGREAWLSAAAVQIESQWFWKLADYFAILVELAVVPTVLRRQWFCASLTLLTVFHLLVSALFAIHFWILPVIYLAFFPLPVIVRRVGWRAFPVALAVGAAAIWNGKPLGDPLGAAVVCVGAVLGIAYLVHLLNHRHGLSAARSSRRELDDPRRVRDRISSSDARERVTL